MDISLALNSLVCTCDTDSNAKLDLSELGTIKCQTVQSWVLGQTLGSMEFGFLDFNHDSFIDIIEFNQAIAHFGFVTTLAPITTSIITTTSIGTTSPPETTLNSTTQTTSLLTTTTLTSTTSTPPTTTISITTTLNDTTSNVTTSSNTTPPSTTSTTTTSTTPTTTSHIITNPVTYTTTTTANITTTTALMNSTTSTTNIACGGDISGPSGTITSPGWPNGYPNNMDCLWNITCGGPTDFAHIVFQRFSLEACK